MKQTEIRVDTDSPAPKHRDNDGLHKRRDIWHYKLKIAGRWKEISTKTTNYQKARKTRQDAVQAQEQGQLRLISRNCSSKKLPSCGWETERL